jgi:hypothetical protein
MSALRKKLTRSLKDSRKFLGTSLAAKSLPELLDQLARDEQAVRQDLINYLAQAASCGEEEARNFIACLTKKQLQRILNSPPYNNQLTNSMKEHTRHAKNAGIPAAAGVQATPTTGFALVIPSQGKVIFNPHLDPESKEKLINILQSNPKTHELEEMEEKGINELKVPDLQKHTLHALYARFYPPHAIDNEFENFVFDLENQIDDQEEEQSEEQESEEEEESATAASGFLASDPDSDEPSNALDLTNLPPMPATTASSSTSSTSSTAVTLVRKRPRASAGLQGVVTGTGKKKRKKKQK